MTDSAARAAAPDASPISAFGAVAGTFAQPVATFGRLVKKPTWWLPFVLALASFFASTYLVAPKIDLDRSIRDMLEKRNVPQERVEQIIKDAQQSSTPLRAALRGSAFFVPVFLLIALVFWGALKAFGADATFKQTLAIWGHANLANVVGTFFSIPLFLQLPDESITQKAVGHFVKSSLGAFLPESLGPFVISIASSIDVFPLATLALLIVGFRRIPELGKGAALAVPLSLWGLYVLGKATLAAVFFG